MKYFFSKVAILFHRWRVEQSRHLTVPGYTAVISNGTRLEKLPLRTEDRFSVNSNTLLRSLYTIFEINVRWQVRVVSASLIRKVKARLLRVEPYSGVLPR